MVNRIMDQLALLADRGGAGILPEADSLRPRNSPGTITVVVDSEISMFDEPPADGWPPVASSN